jgi:hypothetical protein
MSVSVKHCVACGGIDMHSIDIYTSIYRYISIDYIGIDIFDFNSCTW